MIESVKWRRVSVYYEIDARLYCFLLTGKMYLTEKEKDDIILLNN